MVNITSSTNILSGQFFVVVDFIKLNLSRYNPSHYFFTESLLKIRLGLYIQKKKKNTNRMDVTINFFVLYDLTAIFFYNCIYGVLGNGAFTRHRPSLLKSLVDDWLESRSFQWCDRLICAIMQCLAVCLSSSFYKFYMRIS